jgi:hypothetical protein
MKWNSKIASILAFIIGAMAVFAGGKVLLGQLPDYYVISWLPVYNFAMGAISLLAASVLIWKGHRWAKPLALGTLAAHSIVMLVLVTAYGDVVASDSLRAMTIRIVVWGVISLLLFVRKKDD